MNYIETIPEVIVTLGEHTEYEEKEPPFTTVKKLHILLEDWLGDDLMTIHPVYIVTERLKQGLEKTDFSGFSFAKMLVTKDEYFYDNCEFAHDLPPFHWLKIHGEKDKDDLYEYNYKLYVSQDFYKWLKENYRITYAELNPEPDEFNDFLEEMLRKRKEQENNKNNKDQDQDK